MTSGSWKKVKSLFFAASELSPAERSEFLRHLDGPDKGVNTEIRDEVQEMLRGEAEAGSFMNEALFTGEAIATSQDAGFPPAAPVQFAAGDIIADRYRITRYIARGGMGEVYEAEDLDLGILIAIKAIRPNVIANEDMLYRFKREIDLARRVTHPNIGRIYDFGRHRSATGEIPFLTMELLLGETVSERIKRTGPIPVAETLEIVRDIVAALDAIHKCGIVHRDFKSSNVMLIEHNHRITARVMDFGLARPTIGDGTLTQTGQIGGTPPYMAPEQFENVATPATDLYALGIVMHEMLLGVRPRAAGIEKSTAKLHTLPENWATVITTCIAVDPKDRYQSAPELLNAIESKAGVVVTEVSAKRRSKALVRKVWVAAGICAITIVAGLGWWLASAGTPVHAAPKRIAILPIHTDSKSPLDEAFCEGLANTLRSDLAELETSEQALWVIPSSEVREVRTSSAAARQTGATLIVEGTFSRTPSGLSLNTELVDARTNRVLHSKQLQAADAGALREQEFPLLAGMLGLQVAPQASGQIAQTGTKEPGAFDYYEQGLGYVNRTDLIDFDLAIDLFSKSLSRDPKFALAYAGLGEAYARKYSATQDPQWLQKARENGTKAVALNDHIAQVHMTLAHIDELTGRNLEALREARRSLEIEPGCTRCLLVLGTAYVNEGKLEEANKAYQSILNLRSGEWIGYAGLAWVEQKRGHLAKSVELFKKVVDLVPDNAHVLADLGGTYVLMEQYESAVSVLQKAIRIKPQDEAYSNLGAALMYEKRYPEAVHAMEQAVQLAPENHNYWRNLGDSYRQVPTERERAAGAYSKALEKAKIQLAIKKSDADLESCIGLYYAHLGDVRQARRFIEGALKKTPADPDVLFTAAIASELSRDPAAAVRDLDAAWKAGCPLSIIDGEPELFPLHNNARYQSWLARARQVPKV